jgi:hypothetical protein
MNRKLFWLLTAVLLTLPHRAEAQQPRIPRVGLVPGGGDPVEAEAFRQGLRELGYVEGQNIIIEDRYIQGTVNSISSLVAGLVQLKVAEFVDAGGLMSYGPSYDDMYRRAATYERRKARRLAC